MIALKSLSFSLIALVATVVQIVIALAAGTVVGLLYAGWIIAPARVKATFAALFNMAVGFEPAEPAESVVEKQPRVYYEQYTEGDELVMVDYMEKIDGEPYISRKSAPVGARRVRA